MNLYKMELYKILHRKSVLITGLLIILWMAFYFFMMVSDEHTMINGTDYFGYQAIQKDREITAEYEGIFTDEKAASIIAQYGFPCKVVLDVGGWRDSNFLTEFVTDRLSDGYLYGWNEGEYKIPEHLIPMAESELSIYLDSGLPFAYTGGWQKFLDHLQIGALLLNVWFMILFSVLFSEERQTGMRVLICTSDKGVTVDLWAKIGAAFTICLAAGLMFHSISFLLFKAVFGLTGGSMPASLVIGSYAGILKYTTIGQLAVRYSVIMPGAFLMQTAICIWVSSKAGNNFQAVLTNSMILLVPPALYLCMRGIFLRLLSGSLPFLLVQYNNVIELSSLYRIQLSVISAVLILGITDSRKNWMKIDSE